MPGMRLHGKRTAGIQLEKISAERFLESQGYLSLRHCGGKNYNVKRTFDYPLVV